MTGREFDGVTRADVSGVVIDGAFRLADAPPRTSTWFPCGLYRIGSQALIVVDEPLSMIDRAAVARASLPAWATALVVCTVLTTAPDRSPVIEIDLLRPAGVAADQAAFCVACAAFDDGFSDLHPVDALVRVAGRPVRVRAGRRAGSGWSGTVSDLTATERAEADRWRVFRSVGTRLGWGGWDASGFRWSERSPYDLAGLVPYVVVLVGDLAIAVVAGPITADQRAGLAATPLPTGIDVLVAARLITRTDQPVVRIDAEPLSGEPGTDPAAVAVAVAATYELGGQLDVRPERCLVRLAGAELSVIMETEVEDGVPVRTFRSRPAAS